MKSLCVYLGANAGKNSVLNEAAIELGKLLAKEQIRLIYGGSNYGLMGQLANSALSNGGQVTGILCKELLHKEKPLDALDELIVTDTIQERKLQLQQRSDAFVVFPGGIGTLEEAFETWNAIKIGTLKTPIGFLNINGYYDKLFDFILDCNQEYGLIAHEHTHIPVLHHDIEKLFNALRQQAI